jgi:hypothetical protein
MIPSLELGSEIGRADNGDLVAGVLDERKLQE